MLIQIVKESPNCTWQLGLILKMQDKRAQRLIDDGIAIAVEDGIREYNVPAPVRRKGNPFMLPPRFICGCGMVFDNSEELEGHREKCV
jgi:hypothetical protein